MRIFKNINKNETNIYIVNNKNFKDQLSKKGFNILTSDSDIKENSEQNKTIENNEFILILDEEKIEQQDLSKLFLSIEHPRKGEIYYCKYRKDAAYKQILDSFRSSIDKEIFESPVLFLRLEDFLFITNNNFSTNDIIHEISFLSQKLFFKLIPFQSLQITPPNNSNEHNYFKEIKRLYAKKPLQYLFSGQYFKEIFSDNNKITKDALYRFLMKVCSLAMLVIMLLVVNDYGVTGDEPIGHRHSENVIKYYTENSSTAWDNSETNMKYYGFSANVIAEITSHITHWDIWEVRHYTNLLIAFVGLLFAGLTGIRIAGGLGGLLAILFLFLTPRYFGNSMNNLSDIPFATGYIISTYYIIRLFDFWPKIKSRYVLGLILGIAFTISNRAPGILLYGYFLLYAALYYIFVISGKDFYKLNIYKRDILKFTWTFLIILIFSYFLSLVLWPYGLERPLFAVYDSVVTFSKFPWSLTTLFNGIQNQSNRLPVSYAPTYLLIGMPIFILAGVLLFVVSVVKKHKPNPAIIILVFGCIFPIVYIIAKNSNIYGGMRHLTFVVTYFVLVAAYAWTFIFNSLKKYFKIIPLVILTLLLALPMRHMIKNHPNEYVYFNELIGGMKGAYGNYDLDYYYNSIKIGSEWLKENEELKDSITIITNASYTGYFDDYPNIKMDYSRYYETSRKDWDYAIYSNVFIRREQLTNGFFPPKGTIHTIDVDGYPVAAIFKRVSKEDLMGFDALQENRIQEAKEHFKNYLNLNPNSEQVLEGYANVMLKERNLDSTIIYADSALIYNPDQVGALFLKASALNTKKQYELALESSNATIELKKDFAEGHFQKGYALKNLNQPNEALKAFQIAIGYKKDYTQAYLEVGNILCNYKNYAKAIEIYDKLLELQPNNLQGMVFKAKCLQLSEKNDQAEELLNQIPASNQNNLEVVKVKCRIAMAKNNWNLAANYLNMARFITNDADLFVLRSKYVLRQNDLTLAEKYIKSALEFDPINREAQEVQKSLQASAKSAQQNQTQSNQQQSVMFQKPEQKKTNPITIPTR